MDKPSETVATLGSVQERRHDYLLGIEQRLKEAIRDLRKRESVCRDSVSATGSRIMKDSADDFDYRASLLEKILNG